jgi:hypothetical protein
MERLNRWREPATVVVLVALVVDLVMLLLSAAASTSDWGLMATNLAFALADPVLLLLLTAVVVACWVAEPSPRARGLTMAALVLTSVILVGVAVSGVAALVLAPVPIWSAFLLQAVPPLVAGVVALGTSIALLRRPSGAATPTLALETVAPEEEPIDPQQQPSWAPDTAVGTVWRRAGDATSQRPATSWEAPGAGGAWEDPDPGPDAPSEPTRRTGD